MFKFKQFEISDNVSAMKIGTDSVLLGAWAFQRFNAQEILDIGAGTGIISLMLAQRLPHAHITAIEIDSAAASECRDNIYSTPWKNRIDIVTGDIRGYATNCNFNAIISNPPFYDEPLKSPDPRRALARHGGSLEIHSLISISSQILEAGGHLAMIAPSRREEEITYLMAMNHLDVERLTRVSPRIGISPNRVLIEAVKGLTQRYEINDLSIRESSGDDYTTEYYRLTCDFYLDKS